MTNQIPTGHSTGSLANGIQNTAYTLDEATLIQGFYDPDGDTLKVVGLLADSGDVSELGGGQWLFTPDSQFSGTVTFDYLVLDSKGGEVQGSLDLTMLQVQSPPTGEVTIIGIPQQNETLTASNSLNDSNGLGVITYQWQAAGVTVGTGSSYTVTADEVGKTLAVIASYTDGLGNPERVSSTPTSEVIPPLNHAPTGEATFTLANGMEDSVYTINAGDLLQGFSDSDGDTLSITHLVADKGTLANNNNGTWSLTPTSNYTGAIALSYTVTDGNGGSVAATQSFVVQARSVTPAFMITQNDVFTGEDGDTAIISVQLATAPARDVSVTFASSDLTECTITHPTLSFTSSNWSTAQAFTVVGQNDYLNDGNQLSIISATILSNDVNYRQLHIDPIAVTNKEDVTTVSDARIPIGTVRDMPLKIYGDAIVDTNVVDATTGLFKVTGTLNVNDLLQGLDGNDIFYGQNLQDDLSGGLGNDTLYGGNDEDFLYGESGDDTLFGDASADYLEGGKGNDVMNGGVDDLMADTMVGGEGNDTYYVGYGAGALDVIDDQGLASDVDTVIMPYQLTSYTLPKGIEKGTIAAGTTASNLTGNDSDNALTGNDGKNKLIGAVGRDSLFGGLGDDVLNGGIGDDVLEGGTGKDSLTGGKGKDTFLFNAAIKANVDKIIDFKVIDDTIQLENAVFTKLTTGVLNAGMFVKGAAAHDVNDYVIYNAATGALSYDADGSGAGLALPIAVLGVNLALTYVDFVVI